MPTSSRGWRYWLPKRLDGYILSEVLGPFLGGIFFFTFVFLMFQALRLAEFFIVHGIPGPVIVQLTLLLALSFQPMALPIAFLIAVLVAFGRLSTDHELTAMKANGISVTRIAAPIFGLAAVVVTLSLLLNMEWVPWGQRVYRQTVVKVGNTKVVSSINEGTFTSGFFDLLLFADKVDSKTNELTHVFIFDEREPKNPLAVVAKKGRILPVKTDSQLGSAILLKLENGNIHRNELETETYQKIDFDDYQLYLKVSEGEDNTQSLKPRMMSNADIVRRIQELNRPGARMREQSQDYREFLTEQWRRISIAMSAVPFVLLGIGFGTVRTRSVRSGAALIAFLVIALYWGGIVLASSLAHKGHLHPSLAMQLPNLLVLLAGTWSFRKVMF